MTSVGLTNEGQVLPAMVGYVPGETADAYSFFIDIGNSEIFAEAAPKPRVYLTNGSAGMAAAVATGVIGDARHQLCNWHQGEAMIARIRRGGYTSDEMLGDLNHKPPRVTPGIADRVWYYLKAGDEVALETLRKSLLDEVKPAEQTYLQQYRQPKERQFITY